MASSNTLFSFGPIAIRSNKGLERRKQAKTLIEKVDAVFTFTGIDTDDSVCLFLDSSEVINTLDEQGSYQLTKTGGALFFDNTAYTISIKLPNDTKDAYLFSPIASLVESVDWDTDSKKLNIPIDFGNDLGDFDLCWEWIDCDDNRHSSSFTGQVFSTKLDIYTHFTWMIRDVENRFKWIELDLLRRTTWGWQNDTDTEANLKTWLMVFQEVRSSMEEGFNRLIQQHRRKLVSETKMLRAEQMRKISPRLEEKVAESTRINSSRRYLVEKKVLDADTPENRYMKHILLQTLSHLNDIVERISGIEKISDQFKVRLEEWSDELSILKQHRFWRGIGNFHGLRKESLILSQDPLYAGIRRSWFLLHQGVQLLDNQLKGGIQNAAQLYEVWCLVQMDRIIRECGWSCEDDQTKLYSNAEDNFITEELRTDAVKFHYYSNEKPGIKLDMLFQPTANSKPNKNIWQGMMAVPTVQQPDIVIRFQRNDLEKKPVYTWIFDAKYRINGNNAPDDAINQMHRYRDAIIWNNETGVAYNNNLSRESIGAFVLYPGNEKDGKYFPQIRSIETSNIGAFPLLPQDDNILAENLKVSMNKFINLFGKYGEDTFKSSEMNEASKKYWHKGSHVDLD